MRTLSTVLAAGACLALAACSVESTEAPPLAGPSTFATDIRLTATPDFVLQNGLEGSVITAEVKNATGQPADVCLRAEIQVSGVAQDFGTLSSKRLCTSGGLVRATYFPPAANAGVTTGQTVTIAVYPEGTDAGTQEGRYVTIRVLPPGVIGNPTLAASFTVTPAAPQAFTTATFDASASTNQGVACGNACSYGWDFGDGTTGSGVLTTHEYRRAGTFSVVLTVTDPSGFRSSLTQTLTVGPSTPPTASLLISPSSAGVNQDVFFNASQSRAATGRTITRYEWDFGDGRQGSGVTANHAYGAPATYTVVITVTDDAAATAQATGSVTVAAGLPTVQMTILPTSPKNGQPVTVDASASTAATGSTIASYTFNWGDGSPLETSTVGIQSHTYNGSAIASSTVVVTVTVTDNLGRKASRSQTLTITP